ncbi:40S ribosomal protein S4-2 [Spatholobus suberectus]|nr:40S ribosomal protein S4-2 [Spatholobus suberectus]
MAIVTECSHKSTLKISDPWPFRIKLTTDRMRWDSLKISPSKEFEEYILGHMNESSRKALESWIPVNILIYDVDTCETYDAKLSKKESFWFDPMPVLGEKPKKGECPCSFKTAMREPPCYNLAKAREEFAYSIEPFRHIIRKRDLKYDQEIGLRYCGGKCRARLCTLQFVVCVAQAQLSFGPSSTLHKVMFLNQQVLEELVEQQQQLELQLDVAHHLNHIQLLLVVVENMYIFLKNTFGTNQGCNVLQVTGLKKHLKRLNAAKHYMLDKLGGAFSGKCDHVLGVAGDCSCGGNVDSDGCGDADNDGYGGVNRGSCGSTGYDRGDASGGGDDTCGGGGGDTVGCGCGGGGEDDNGEEACGGGGDAGGHGRSRSRGSGGAGASSRGGDGSGRSGGDGACGNGSNSSGGDNGGGWGGGGEKGYCQI